MTIKSPGDGEWRTLWRRFSSACSAKSVRSTRDIKGYLAVVFLAVSEYASSFDIAPEPSAPRLLTPAVSNEVDGPMYMVGMARTCRHHGDIA
jgi:hypothetical protein